MWKNGCQRLRVEQYVSWYMVRKWMTSVPRYKKQVTVAEPIVNVLGGLAVGQNLTSAVMVMD
jgi:hypothetical protein